MKRSTVGLLVLAMLGFAAAEAFALLIPFSKERIAAHGKYCVHGYDGNFGAVGVYYAGDAAALNEHLLETAKQLREPTFATPVVSRKIILHPGPMILPEYLERERRTSTDWLQTTWFELETTKAEMHLQIDVWIGGRIKLDELRIPAEFTVESGREIETFVEQHNKGLTTPPTAP